MTPSSAAFTGVFSGSAMLMPSFCWPLGVGPEAAITRPLAGQRNFGSEPVASADFVASFAAGTSAAVATKLTVCTGSGLLGRAGGRGLGLGDHRRNLGLGGRHSHTRNDETVADIERGARLDVVGLG